MKIKRIHIFSGLLLICVLLIPFRADLRYIIGVTAQMCKGKETIGTRLKQCGDTVHKKLGPEFERIDIKYPPAKIVMVGLKEEKNLEIWVSSNDTDFKLLKIYPILGASGVTGPKLKEGDMQVPEGLYEIELLNPNSLFHLALRVNYPNEFDLKHAEEDGRTNPGSDIMIHGNTCSVGCLAMGDEAIEEIFVLSAETGINKISLILSPSDLRTKPVPDTKNMPAWTGKLYEQIKTELIKLGKAGK